MSMAYSLAEGDQSALSVKTVILGEPGVGKTCIANRFVSNVYKECEPTTGASYAQKIVFNAQAQRSIKFDIWDTAGQEKYRAMNKIFYKDAKVAILVYDITRQSSFEEVKNYWVGQLRENADKNIGKEILIYNISSI
jgi:small GTP-binding protein